MYPLVFSSAANRVYDIVEAKRPGTPFAVVALALFSIAATIGVCVDDVGQAVSVCGALFVPIFVSIIPGLLSKKLSEFGTSDGVLAGLTSMLDQGLIAWGMFIIVKGLSDTIMPKK